MKMTEEIKYPLPVKIAGMGRYLPEYVVKSEDIEKKLGLEKGWCLANQGVIERHWVKNETRAFMGARAALEAIENAGIEIENIDLIINASSGSDTVLPEGASLIQKELGLGNSGIPCMTVDATCLSFMVSLDMTASLLAVGKYNNILIVSSEISSKNIDPEDPETYTLFGDGAAAAVVTLTPEGEYSAIHAARHETYGEGAYFTQVPGFGSRRSVEKNPHYFRMDGQQVMQLSLKCIEGFSQRFATAKEMENVKLVIPHQASKLMLDYLSFYVPDESIVRTLSHFGNTVASSMPIALYEAIKSGRMERGDVFYLTGTGSGMSFGAALLTY